MMMQAYAADDAEIEALLSTLDAQNGALAIMVTGQVRSDLIIPEQYEHYLAYVPGLRSMRFTP